MRTPPSPRPPGAPRPPWWVGVFGGLPVRAHIIAGLAVLGLLVGAAVLSVQFLGDASAIGPRAKAPIGADSQPYAPRVAFADAATSGDPDALLGAGGYAPQPAGPSAGLPMVQVDPGLDAPGAITGPGAGAGLGALPPTLDLLPETPTAASLRLAPAPLAGLHAGGAGGLLPIRAEDGRTAAQAYARPFRNPQRRPAIGIVVGGLGFNARVTQAAIDDLPPEVTLAFMPYTPGLQDWLNRARANGHEVLIEAPMESWDPRADDTGPNTLMIAASPAENIARLEAVLARAAGYFGVMNYLGQRFVTAPEASAPVAGALAKRGLAMIGNGVGARSAFGVEAARAGLAFAPADRVLDANRNAEAIGEQLLALESLAQRGGAALGVGFAFPVTIEQIKVWTAGLAQRGFALAPASAIIALRAAPR